MVGKLLISGVIGVFASAGFARETHREPAPSMSRATQESVQACYRNNLESATSIDQWRSMGRGEAHLTTFDPRNASQAEAGASSGLDGRDAIGIYRLRSFGREEDRRAVRDDGVSRMAPADPKANVYGWRSRGRWEAHETGTDYCKAVPEWVDRFGVL